MLVHIRSRICSEQNLRLPSSADFFGCTASPNKQRASIWYGQAPSVSQLASEHKVQYTYAPDLHRPLTSAWRCRPVVAGRPDLCSSDPKLLSAPPFNPESQRTAGTT